MQSLTNSPQPKPETNWHLFDAAVKLNIMAKTPDRSLHMPVSQLVGKLTDYPKFIADPQTGLAMTIEQLTVDMPIELKVIVNPDGTVNVKGSPPTQLVQTTVMPVFHHMRLKVVRKDDE
jgi:hypothetical protein